MFQDLMNTEIFGGNTIADFLTLNMLASIAGSVVGAVVIIVVGWVIAAWLGSRVRKIGTAHAHLDNTLFNFLGSIVQYVIIGFTMLIVLNTFGVQTTSIVAAVGAAGLAIGLALQGTLSNVAAGVMLILFRPLKIGDFVDVAGQMGTVKDVTLNFTELASLSNTQVIIPNKEVWGNVIENYSVYPTRRAEWYFGVGYGANLKDAEETIRETIMSDPRAHKEPEPFIQVGNLGDSSVDFRVRVWCNASDYFAFTNDMNRKVKEALDAKGVDIPFPTRTIYQAAAE